MRTALGFVGLGVVLAKLVDDAEHDALMGGAALIAVGTGTLLYAGHRYLRVAKHLVDGRFPVARRGPAVVGVASFVIGLAALLYVLLR